MPPSEARVTEPTLIVMAGLPGTGKSTVAGATAQRLGLAVVSVDPIESAILSAGIDANQPTGLAAYLVAETLAESVLAAGRGVIVDAVNAVSAAREQWVELAGKRGVQLRFLEVSCSDSALHRQRLEARGRRMPHLAEPSWHAVEQSLDEWEDWGGASASYPRLSLDTARPLDELVGEAVAFVAHAQ